MPIPITLNPGVRWEAEAMLSAAAAVEADPGGVVPAQAVGANKSYVAEKTIV